MLPKRTFSPDEAIGIFFAKSLGHYKINHNALQQNLNNYHFENLHKLFDEFNTYNGNMQAL